MLNKRNSILFGLLVFQLILVVWLTFGSRALNVSQKEDVLVSFDPNSAKAIKINDNQDQAFELIKQDAKWIIPASENFPADSEKVEEVLEQLSNLKIALPAANTKIAAKQLKTANDDYKLKVEIKTETKNIIYFGNVPTFKKVYARAEVNDPTYIVDFQTHELSTEVTTWFKKDLLKLDNNQVSALSFNDVHLNKQEGRLVLEDLQDSEEVQDNEVKKLLTKISNISYATVPSSKQPEGFDKAGLYLGFNLQYGSKDYQYEIHELSEDEFYLKTSFLSYYFKINKSIAQELKGFKRSDLVQEKVEEESEVAEEASPENEVAVKE